MSYPIRSSSHVTETASFKRLEQCLPPEWIVRYLSERDYGLDLLIEPVAINNSVVKGDMFAIQLKGTESLKWNNSERPQTIFSGTEKSSVNYWMGLPLPVFLCVHDQSTNFLFFAPVQHQVRRRYNELKTQSSFGFKLNSIFELSTNIGKAFLLKYYFRERSYLFYSQALTDLLIHREIYMDYIEENLNRDSFMSVETTEILRLQRLLQNIIYVAEFTGIKHSLPSLSDLFKEDYNVFKDPYEELHEQTQDRAIRLIVPVFISALEKSHEVISKLELHYWNEKEPLLVRSITEYRDSWINDAKERLKGIKLK